MIYLTVRSLLRFFYRTWFRSEAVGLSNVPAEGPVIICCNHISLWDPPTLGIFLNRKIRYMAKSELFAIPGFGWFIRQLGAFPVKRGGVSKDSIRVALDLLNSGEMIGIFPEGTRNRTGTPMGKRGAAHLAFKSAAIVIPAAIVTRYKPFGKVKIIYGKPVDLAELVEEGTSDAQTKATDKIMEAIYQLIKPMNGNRK